MSRPITLAAAGLAALASLALAAPAGAQMSFISNSRVQVGVDLAQGGAITHVSTPNGPNVVNSWDLGRQVQQSYYAGPDDFGDTRKPEYDPWPWNPVAAGDTYRNPSRVLAHSNDRQTIYVRSQPKQWALANVDCECTFEQWITLDGNSVHVRSRLHNARSDATQYPARDQELPAVYVNGAYSRFFTYAGDRPFLNEPVEERGPVWPARQYMATERWAAWMNKDGFGLGVISLDVQRFGWGFCPCGGTPGTGGPRDGQTGYISPVAPEVLDHDIVFDYGYDLVLGSVADVRRFAYAHAKDPRPRFDFSRDRQHFTLRNATDTGWPISGALRVRLDGKDPHVIGPEERYPAAGAPKLYIRAAFHSRAQRTAELFWRPPGGDFTQQRSARLDVVPDGQPRTYVVDLAGEPTYTGTIERLRFDPLPGGEAGARADIAWIGWTPPPPPPSGTGDRSAPRVSISARGRQRLARRGLRLRVRCSEPCTASGRATARAKRRRTLRVALRSTRLRSADRWRTVRMRPSSRTYRRLRSELRRRRTLTFRVTVHGRDAAGNRGAARRRITVARPRRR